MIYSIYSPVSGIIISQVSDANQIQNRPYVVGRYEPGQFYVKDRQIRPLPARPPSQSQVSWRWNPAAQTWEYDQSKTDQNARKIRETLFAEVDKVNPMWFESMTAEQQQQVREYRQAIIDLTDQPGWPRDITWPVKPAWL